MEIKSTYEMLSPGFSYYRAWTSTVTIDGKVYTGRDVSKDKSIQALKNLLETVKLAKELENQSFKP